MAFTRGGDSRQHEAAQEASEGDKLERAFIGASPRGRGQRGCTQPFGRATIRSKRGGVEHTGVQVLIRRPRRCTCGGGCDASERHSGVRWKRSPAAPGRRVRLRSALRRHQLPQRPLRPRKRRSTISHLQSIIHTGIGREEFGKGMTTFGRKIVDEPDAFPPEFWQLFLQSSRAALGRKYRPVCVGMT